MLPRVGVRSPEIVRSSVVLPAPLAPTTAMTSPGAISSVIRSSTGVTP